MNTRRVLARCCSGEMRMSVVMKRADLIWRGFLFHAVVTICFGVFILLATIDSIRIHLSNGSLEMNVSLVSIDILDTNRSRCCVPSFNTHQHRDICGRRNYTLPCPDLGQYSHPEFDFQNPKFRDKPKGFLIETSGSGVLTDRQACAAESLASINPEMAVYILFIDVNPSNHSTSTIMSTLMRHYKNIQVIPLQMNDYLAGTPLERWYHCTDWRQNPHRTAHLSNGLRLLMMYKYGGYYFDLDMIHVRPVTYYRNFVSSTKSSLVSSALHADYEHPLMKKAVEHFVKDYKSDIWAHNGTLLRDWCQTEEFTDMNYIRCKGFHVLPENIFSPVFYEEEEELPWLPNDTIAIHTWNKMNSDQVIHKKRTTQFYSRMARTHCPITYSIAIF